MSSDRLIEEVFRLRRRSRLALYQPYPKQFAFHEAGAHYRERMMLKGNRAGGTTTAAYEMAMHLTGRYPDWFPGKRYKRPVTAVIGSESNEASRDIIQLALFGTPQAQMRSPDFGTGTIPADDIKKISTRQAGVRDVIDQAIVRNINGGESRVLLKTYEMGRSKWQGFLADIFWADEEPPIDILSEGIARTATVTDGMGMFTFTALKGMTPVVLRYLRPEEGDSAKSVTRMTIYDAVGGVWPEGTPWAGKEWSGHFTKEQADAMVASYPEWERETRAMGEPAVGEGRVFPFPDPKCDPFEIPKHFRRIIGIDFGIDHPFAAVELCHSGSDGDIVYVTKAYKQKGQMPAMQGAAVNSWGGWQPIAWPHDGENRDKGSGTELHKIYRKPITMGGAGMERMLPMSARYDNDKGGSQAVEPIVVDFMERISTGRLKVFSTLSDWFDEYRGYHRKDGKIVPINDDLLKATMYAAMMLRYAAPEFAGRMPQRAGAPKLRMWG